MCVNAGVMREMFKGHGTGELGSETYIRSVCGESRVCG